MSIFSKVALRSYSQSWKPIKEEKFDVDDIEAIESIEVVASNYGTSGKVIYKDSPDQCSFIPLSRENQDLPVGKILDLDKCFLVTLIRGNSTCEKLLYKGE